MGKMPEAQNFLIPPRTLFANSAALMCLNTGTPGKHLFPIYDTQKINGLGVSILKNIGLTFILDKST